MSSAKNISLMIWSSASRDTSNNTLVYNPAKPSGRGGGPPPSWEGDLLVLQGGVSRKA